MSDKGYNQQLTAPYAVLGAREDSKTLVAGRYFDGGSAQAAPPRGASRQIRKALRRLRRFRASSMQRKSSPRRGWWAYLAAMCGAPI
jgi:hypothetical protein